MSALQLDLHLGQPAPIARIDDALRQVYGDPAPTGTDDPMHRLVRSVLRPGTRDDVADAAMQRLQRYFPAWEQLAGAGPSRIESLLDPVTGAAAKARRLMVLLDRLRAESGSVSLAFLGTEPAAAARAWLERVLEVDSVTSAAIVQAAGGDRRLPAVDRHHLRVARRLGLLRPGANLEAAPRLLQRQIPAGWSAGRIALHHQRMRLHGQLACGYGQPDCGACPLTSLCPKMPAPLPAGRTPVRAGAQQRPMPRDLMTIL